MRETPQMQVWRGAFGTEYTDGNILRRRRYVWGLEYYAPQYQEVEYRGHKALLWKTDFAKLYLDAFPDLRLVKQRIFRELDGPNEDIMFLLEKPASGTSG